MKQKASYLIFIIILLSALQSCEDNFSPYGDFDKKYSLNCIVRGDTSLQVTTLFESFSPNKNTSKQNINDYFVNDAFIRLWSGNDEIYYLRDTVLTDSDSNSISKYYYANIIKPKSSTELEIEALLPDGNRLKSKTTIPNEVKKDVARTTEIISNDVKDKITFAWISDNVDQIYIPTLSLYYKERIGDRTYLKIIEIPWKYQTENGIEVAINKPPSKTLIMEISQF